MSKLKKKKNQLDPIEKRFSGLKHKMMALPPVSALSFFKAHATVDEIKRFTKRISKIERFSSIIYPHPFPKQIEDLGKGPNVPMGSFEIEYAWHACLLESYTREINEFIEDETAFYNAYIQAKYVTAKEILDRIQDKFGYSIWLLENRLSLLQDMSGLEDQKKFASEIKSNKEIRGNVRFFIFYLSYRAEKNVTAHNYKSHIINVTSNPKYDKRFAEYLRYKVNRFHALDVKSYADIIGEDGDYSVIDIYLSMLFISQSVCFSGTVQQKKLISSTIKYLFSKIVDPRQRHLKYQFYIEPINISQQDLQKLQILDSYTEGNYSETFQRGVSYMLENPCDVEVAEIVLRAKIHDGLRTSEELPTSLRTTLMSHMLNILLKNEGSQSSYRELNKYALVNCTHTWSYGLAAFLNNAYSLGKSKKCEVSLFAAISAITVNPKYHTIFSDMAVDRDYLSDIAIPGFSGITIKLLCSLNQDVSVGASELGAMSLPSERHDKYRSILFMQNGLYARAIGTLEALANSNDVLVKQFAITHLLECYLKINRPDLGIELLVSAYFENPHFVSLLPIDDLLNSYETTGFDLSGALCLPIAYDIYAKFISSTKDARRRNAYEDFLTFHHLRRPSELKEIMDKFPQGYLIYFLRYLCVPEVMFMSIEFNSSKDLDIERLSVCQTLIEIDRVNTKVYTEEIKNITRKLSINEGIKHVEQSKIYVDTDSIKRTVKPYLEESYNRYISFLVNGELRLEEQHPDHNDSEGVTYPVNEKLDLFYSMLDELKKQFVLSKHGLDGFLSTRIRHIVLAGQLRNPLELTKLITQKDSLKGSYKDNAYWRDTFAYVGLGQQSILLKRLAAFSREIDNQIEILNNRWIRIKDGKDYKDGLFDFTNFDLSKEQIRNYVTIFITYDDFVDTVFDILWASTEASLSVIRDKLSVDFKNTINSLLSELQVDVRDILGPSNSSIIETSIVHARTEMYTAIDKVISWFKLSKSVKYNNFTIDIAIDIALKAIWNIYTDKSLSLKLVSFPLVKFNGLTLISLVDIFFMLFDNIVKHSMISCEVPVAEIDIKMDEPNKVLVLVQNKISDQVDQTATVAKLHDISYNHKHGHINDFHRKEGNTGYYKISNIINNEFGCEHEMFFGFLDEHTYFVKIQINARKILI